MELLLIAIVLTLIDAQQSQFEGPQNTLNVVGLTVSLKCSSPSRNCIGTDWQKYVHGYSPMTIFKGPRTMLNVVDKDRYSVDNSSGCDLVIRNVQLADAGRFICSAIVSSSQAIKTAYLVILETRPNCTLNVSLHDTVDGDGVQLKCEVKYNGTDNASMNWKGVIGAPPAVKNGNIISRSYSVEASEPEVPSFTCETSFTLQTTDDPRERKPIGGLATNSIPVETCETPVIQVFYSVRGVILTPPLSNYPPRTGITCSARGHPFPTFKWQENGNNDIWTDIQNQNGSQFTMSNVSSKKYRCVARNVVRGKNHNATSIEFQVNNTDAVWDVTLSPSYSNYPPGTIITCTAKGNPSPTFKWQEMVLDTWVDIQNQNGPEFTTTSVSSKRYRCVAMNVVSGRSYTATSNEILFNNTDSVRDVTLSPSLLNYPPGTVITCTAKGHPLPTFKWQEMESGSIWMDIRNQHDSEFTMTDVSSKRYRCVAMNVVRGESFNATSHEILHVVDNADRLGIGIGIGIGFGVGLLVAILLATVVFAILVKVRCIDVHPRSAKKSPDDHMDQESRQRSPMTGAPLTGEQDSTYASLGEDRDVNEYASLEQRQKKKRKKMSKL